MAVIQFDLRHRINIVDKCADTLRICRVIDCDASQSQILNHNTRCPGKATGEQRRVQTSDGVVLAFYGDDTRTTIAINRKRIPAITGQVIILVKRNGNIARTGCTCVGFGKQFCQFRAVRRLSFRHCRCRQQRQGHCQRQQN